MKTAVLYQTHFFDRWAEAAFRRLSRGLPPGHDAIVLMHLPPGAPVPERVRRVPHHILRTPDLRAMPYPEKAGARGGGWDLWQGGHTDLITLHFCLAHPEYDFTWTVEYDVAFSGRWRRFFDAFADDPTDLLAPVIFRRRDYPDWIFWPSLVTPGAAPDEMTSLRSFMPVFRMSRRLIVAADEAYRAGWGGHLECSLGTIAMLRGLSVADIGDNGEFTAPHNRGRFYSSNRLNSYLWPGTMMFKPTLHRVGSKPDMLWHPVKPFWLRAELRTEVLRLRSGLAGWIRGRAPWMLPARWRAPGTFSRPR